MRQYYITTDTLNTDSQEDCVLDASDPIHELKIIQYLAGLGSEARLHEYRAQNAKHNQEINKGSNISVTGNEKAQLMREQNIKPGTPEWFRLWFSRPYLTNETPTENK